MLREGKPLVRARWWTSVFVVALGTALLTPAEAMAAPADAAPGCVSVRQWDDWTITGYRSYAEVKNNCLWEYRVRVIWKNDLDGSCKSVRPGTGFTEWRQGKMPSVDEIRLC